MNKINYLQMIEKTKILKILSVLTILLNLYVLTLVHDKTNDELYYDRYYTVIKKNIGSHLYKGKGVIEYYLTVKYDDDPKVNWISEVPGTKYFSVDENKKYSKRELKNPIFYVLLFILILLSVVSLFYLLFMYL